MNFRVLSRLYNFSREPHLLLDYEETGIVALFTTVVRARSHSHKLIAGESIEASEAGLVAAQDHSQIINLEELFDTVRPELHYVESLLRVSHSVGNNLEFFLSVGGVAPQEVDHQLLLLVGDIEAHFKRAFDLLDVFNLLSS